MFLPPSGRWHWASSAGTSRRTTIDARASVSEVRRVSLNAFVDRTVAIDDRTGTTTIDLWPSDRAPTTERASHGIDDWLHLVAAGQAVGITAEATTHLHPRAGLRFRPVRDAEPLVVWLAWRRADPPDRLDTLLQLVREAYARG